VKRAMRQAPPAVRIGGTATLQATLEATADAILIVDADGRPVAINRGLASLCGIPQIWVGDDLRPHQDEIRTAVRGCLNGAASHADRSRDGVRPGRPKVDTLRLADGRLMERSLWPRRQSGRIIGWVWSFHDITDLDRRLREATLLSDATDILAGADLPVAMERLGRRLIPFLAEAVAIDLMEESSAHRVMSLADIELLPAPDKALRMARAGYAVRFHTQSSSCLVAPITIGGELCGALTLAAASRRRYSRADLRVAEELGRRLGTTVENARRTSEMRDTLQARSAILSIAAHEIRGPATTIHLAVQELLEGSSTPASTSRMLGIIERAHRRLVRFVDDLLDVGRIDAGRMTFELSPVDLCAVVRDVVARLEVDVQHSRCSVQLHLEDGVVGQWDRFRVDQIVANLVANALKYGEGGPVDITVAADGDFARFEVRDQGPGIAPELVGRLFRPFERTRSNAPGYGLGLYIVKLIVERFGGTVAAENRPDGGSLFKVLLPLPTLAS